MIRGLRRHRRRPRSFLRPIRIGAARQSPLGMDGSARTRGKEGSEDANCTEEQRRSTRSRISSPTRRRVILADYRGLTVKEMQELRTKLREAGARVEGLQEHADRDRAARTGAAGAWTSCSQGPTAFTFSSGDPVAPAKALMDFAKDHKALEVKGGFVEQHVVGADRHQGARRRCRRARCSSPSCSAPCSTRSSASPVSSTARSPRSPARVQAVADQKAAA